MTVDQVKLSTEILQDLISFLTKEASVSAFQRENQIRQYYDKAQLVKPVKGELKERSPVYDMTGRDIYGLEKSSDVKYFLCKRCERSVASHRFAAHVARCSGRGRR